MGKLLEQMETVMSRANDIRYFVALSTFTLLLDSVLVYTRNVSVLSISWDYISSSFTLGAALVFLCFFSLFMVFVIPSIMSFITFIVIETRAYKVVDAFGATRKHGRDYLSPFSLSQYALNNCNEVAYQMATKQSVENQEKRQMEKYSFAFVLVSVCNWLVSTESTRTIIDIATHFDYNAGLLSVDTAKCLMLLMVYPALAWIGIAHGCGFTSNYLDGYVYAPEINNRINPPRNEL
ncbi:MULTISPECIES: hypothetical protein [Salinivibrio]|uniref:Uncharacterized protein n=1 Tax=Salinivibrio proteolyticus TaxID=334715 RepID=A0ABY7L9C0_9GAMM|nr:MULTISPECIES: hypothetical protein [Salinivibrio]PCE67538.1 hypothetical protein B6G00_04100 [Salinivibrio sp. YCSC6]QCF35555.1 hypothetical protein E8E00_04850 [Salinivibrio sp. YCSC6]WBA13849.1 hypothetical protein N7E60_08905 [Salinivibrio proteolyticus]